MRLPGLSWTVWMLEWTRRRRGEGMVRHLLLLGGGGDDRTARPRRYTGSKTRGPKNSKTRATALQQVNMHPLHHNSLQASLLAPDQLR
jgi:hypothetical protein